MLNLKAEPRCVLVTEQPSSPAQAAGFGRSRQAIRKRRSGDFSLTAYLAGRTIGLRHGALPKPKPLARASSRSPIHAANNDHTLGICI